MTFIASPYKKEYNPKRPTNTTYSKEIAEVFFPSTYPLTKLGIEITLQE